VPECLDDAGVMGDAFAIRPKHDIHVGCMQCGMGCGVRLDSLYGTEGAKGRPAVEGWREVPWGTLFNIFYTNAFVAFLWVGMHVFCLLPLVVV